MFIFQATVFPLPQRWLVPMVIKNSFLIHSGTVSKNLNDCLKFLSISTEQFLIPRAVLYCMY